MNCICVLCRVINACHVCLHVLYIHQTVKKRIKVMRDCPWPLLDAFACDDCYGPPPGFRIGSLVEKTRAAHLAFAKGAIGKQQ